MCALPDVAGTSGAASLQMDHMVCPMGASSMCPPSLTSSSERPIKFTSTTAADPQNMLTEHVLLILSRPSSSGWVWWQSLPIVPLAVSASPVLRI